MEKPRIYFEQVLTGALLKLNSVDSNDLAMLKYDIEKKNNTKIIDSDISNIRDFIRIDDDIISFRKSISLEDEVMSIRFDQLELRKVLEYSQGDLVRNYFEQLDVNCFYNYKNELLNTFSDDYEDVYLLYKQK